MTAFVALLFFALLGFGALAIDIGLASVTESRLRSASDAVALGCNPVNPGSADPGCEALWSVIQSELLAPQHRSEYIEAASLTGKASGADGAVWQASMGVPLLFGQGSMIQFSPSSRYDLGDVQAARSEGQWRFRDDPQGGLREAGFQLKAESFVRFDPIVRIGRDPMGRPGRASFALNADCFDDSDGAVLAEERPEAAIEVVAVPGRSASLRLGEAGNECFGFAVKEGEGEGGYEVGDELGDSGDDAVELREKLERLADGRTPGPVYVPLHQGCSTGESGESEETEVECSTRGFALVEVINREGDAGQDLLLRLAGTRSLGNATARCTALASGCSGTTPLTNGAIARAPVLVRRP